MKKIEAARKLHTVYLAYEVRPVTLSTIYRRMYRAGRAWRIVGYAHDYTVYDDRIDTACGCPIVENLSATALHG